MSCFASSSAPKLALCDAFCELAVNDVDVTDQGVVACASNDRTVRVWSVDSKIKWVGRHTNYVTAVRIGSGCVVSGGTDALLCGWRLEDGEKLWEYKQSTGIISISLCYGLVFSGCQGGSISCNVVDDGRVHWEKAAHEGAVRQVAASPKSEYLLSCANDCMVCCWDVEEDGEQKWRGEGHSSWVTKVAVESSSVVTASLDKTVRCWSLADGSTIWVTTHDSPVLVLALGNGVCCSGTKENKIACRDLQQGELQWEEDIDEITALDVQEGIVLAGSREGKLSCFHLNTSKLLWSSQHADTVTSIRHAGDFSVSGSADKQVRCWKAL
jgi:WD40 repeat protein